MRNHHNIEPSFFKPGEYVGYDGKGHRWRVCRIKKTQWRAYPANNHPGRFFVPCLSGASLSDLAATLAARV